MEELKNETVEHGKPKKAKKHKELSPFDYVTIPVKEYRKLITAHTRLKKKYKDKYEDKIKTANSNSDMYERWYRDKCNELAEAKKVIKGYKETMEKGLGIKEDDRLAEMQFEKGVTNA